MPETVERPTPERLAAIRHLAELGLLGQKEGYEILAELDAVLAENAALRSALAGAEQEALTLRQELAQTLPPPGVRWEAVCSWCSWRRGYEDEATMDRALRCHVATCKDHPLYQAAQEIAALQGVADLADEVRCRWEMEHGPAYDMDVPLEAALGVLTHGLCDVAMRFPRKREAAR